jgi:vancomycin resistance protein VanJ
LSRFARIVRNLSLANLGLTLTAIAALLGDWGNTWWRTLLVFLPHHPFLVAPAVLLVCSLFVRRRWVVVNLICLGLVVGPLMGLRLPVGSLLTGRLGRDGLRIVSCNVQRYQPDFEAVLREIQGLEPDVVALQEARFDNPLVGRFFPGWHLVHEAEFWVLSRFPLARIKACRSVPFQREVLVTVRIDAPSGPFMLHNVHLTTVRHGLEKLSVRSIRDGSGLQGLEQYDLWREIEGNGARTYVEKIGFDLPVLVAGDFNTPTFGRVYQQSWEGFTNAFDTAGWGYGYTTPCSRQPLWPDYHPWVRIDHILADRRWSVSACGVGDGNGSDHRLIWARLKPLAE